MSDETPPKGESTVQLTPGTPAAPKLAVVTPGPKSVVVSVPSARAVKPEAVEGDTEQKANKPKKDKKPKEQADAPDVEVTADTQIKKNELLDEVARESGVKRSEAKAAIDAFLAITGRKLAEGADLQLPPLGKVKVVKTREVGQGGTALTIKIRTPNTE